jgi:hypothetical protein
VLDLVQGQVAALRDGRELQGGVLRLQLRHQLLQQARLQQTVCVGTYMSKQERGSWVSAEE